MKLIDLTLELQDGLQTYPGHPAVSIKEQSTFESSKHRYQPPCQGFESRLICFSDHTGTHVDAPLHFIENGASASSLEIERFLGTALMLDVTPFKEPDQPVVKEMLEKAEEAQGLSVGENQIVLLRTWNRGWGEDGFFEAQALAPCAGEWLAAKKINMVGLDLPNVDINANMRRDVHMNLLGKNIYIVENLVNLDKLPKNDYFTFIGFPLKLKNATASPIRALALLEASSN